MRYVVLGFLCLIAMIAYVQRGAISVPARTIATELHLGDGGMGWILFAWGIGYSALQLPGGWLADRWGGRRALLLYATLWSALTAAAGWAYDFPTLLLVWGLMGAAQAGVFPCAAKTIGAWFPDSQRAVASGMLASSMALGIALSPLLAAKLLPHVSWQQLFGIVAVPGLLWVAAFALCTPHVAPLPTTAKRAVDWRKLLGNESMILLASQQFLRAAAMSFFLTWFPTFLRETRGVSQEESGMLTSQAGLGAFVGGLLGGTCSDLLLRLTGNRRLSRQGIAVVGMAACAALTFSASFVADLTTAMRLISLGAFAGTFGGVSGYTVAIEFGGRHVATVFSLMNMAGNIGAALFPLGVGILVTRFGRWDLVLFLFAAIFAADAVLWALLNPRGPFAEETP
jgi:MFS family permease